MIKKVAFSFLLAAVLSLFGISTVYAGNCSAKEQNQYVTLPQNDASQLPNAVQVAESNVPSGTQPNQHVTLPHNTDNQLPNGQVAPKHVPNVMNQEIAKFLTNEETSEFSLVSKNHANSLRKDLSDRKEKEREEKAFILSKLRDNGERLYLM